VAATACSARRPERCGAAALVAAALLGFTEQAGADEAAIERGRLVAAIGACAACHTAKDGPSLAGGDPLVTPLGSFVAPNLTPDPTTGLGAWSAEDFLRAMREGVAPDGSPYYPSFPFPWYRHLTDADLADLWAFLRAQPPVEKASAGHDLIFPLSLRQGLWGWRTVFLDTTTLNADASRTPAWNRGRYLAEGPGHCGACHTPRTARGFGAPDPARAFAGNEKGSLVGAVPAITPDEAGIGGWSTGAIMTFFELGMTPEGDFVGGEMAKVVEHGTSQLLPEDREALAVYLKEGPAPP
jgi:mono/diheme cytochrome c family protein